ncbi:MAG TPA: BTAD domain-containing putative transcriptional regulator [Longimicrobiales bacterium]
MSTAATSLNASGAVRAAGRIPLGLSAFVGRQRELEEVGALLARHRLVTLSGAAGTGKTRLAAEAARGGARADDRATDRADDVVWIELGSLADGGILAGHVAALLGIREQSGIDVTDTLVAMIADRPLLLVLDNCEHVVDACAALVERLVHECPALHVLATSRQPLGITGEKNWPVPPLGVPTGEALGEATRSEAVQLFVQRAADVSPGFALTAANVDAIVRICRRLDGLPLAIELAAARVTLLTPEQLVRRLDDAFAILTSRSRTTLPRHRTLRALLDWSYDLLDPPERMLLRRLSVFAGGFTLEAAETVPVLDDIPACDVLELLASLVDRSLVTMREQAGEARYSLLETVRQYATARARDEESDATRDLLARRHADYFVSLGAQADDALHGRQQLAALAQLELEHDNLRAALDWSLSQRDGGCALRLCVVLRDFWALRGHLTEGRRWIDEALRIPSTDAGLAARALTAGGRLARLQGDHDVARARHARAVELAREACDRTALAEALTNLGSELALYRDLDGARPVLDEAVALRRELGVAWSLSQALSTRSALALTFGEIAEARALRLEAVEVSRRAGDREGEARALLGLGEAARLADDLVAARTYNEQALELFRQLGETWHVAAGVHNLGWIAVAGRDWVAAQAAFIECFRLLTAMGNRSIGAALCLAGMAPLLHARGETELAVRALATAQREFDVVGIRPAAADQRQWDDTRAMLRDALGAGAFERAWSDPLPGEPAAAVGELFAHLPAGESSVLPLASAAPAATPGVDIHAGGPTELRVLALGPLRVYRDGELMTTEAWGSARPRELLLHLLCWPGGRTRDQIGLVFWPDATAAQVSNSFHVLLYRLRKALGHTEWITIVDERYRLAPDLRIEFDAMTFEREVTALLRAGRTGTLDVPRLEAALALYRGDFLEGEGAGEWHMEMRDRLRRLHVDGLVALGERHMAQARFDRAADAYRRVIAQDELHEPAYRRLMQCLARTGSRADALRLYHRLADLLRAELSTEPEPETLAVYHGLQQIEA